MEDTTISRNYSLALTESMNEVEHEIVKVKGIYPRAFASNHEAYGVLKEEVDELWDEIKRKNPDKANIREEAKQVAAMCLRLMVELT